MKRKRSYTSTDVERFELSTILQQVTVGCIVAIDVAKTKFVAAIATAAGEVLKLVKFEHPRQTRAFLGLLLEGLREAELKPKVVMEPTGTYGDAVRYQCHQRGVPVHMMAPKHTHDFAEVIDGVPSMHDPKAAVTLAKLQAIKAAREWTPDSEAKRDLRAWVDQRAPMSRILGLYHGHLEATLARHWPEFGTLMDVYERRSWFALLKAYPGPQAVAASSEAAALTLRKASRGQLGNERIQAIVDSAKATMGMPMTPGEEEKLRAITEQIEVHTLRVDAIDAKLSELVKKDEVLSRIATVAGPACAAAIGSRVGSPLDFTSASAFEKAMGLNLKEHSSGTRAGKMSITKRGPAEVRQLMFLAALRLLNSDPIVSAWYRARGAYKAEFKIKAVVAVMRKLARALWHVARGEAFNAAKLFDTRRLEVTSVQRSSVSTRTHNAETNSATTKVAVSSRHCEGGAAMA